MSSSNNNNNNNNNDKISLTINTTNNNNSNNEYYLDDAKLSAIMLYQRQIFEKQNIVLKEIVDNRNSNNTSSSSSSSITSSDIPNILLNRIDNQKNSNKNLLDDIEITLLGIFDSNGNISMQCKLMEFIVLMTRVTKIDHRALCLYILYNNITPLCCQYFVLHGGLRLLKRWIKVAEDEDCMDELCMIIKICRKLPFDKNVVKESDIGKSIKKLLKYKSPSDKDTTILQQAVKDVMDYWTKCLSNKALSEIKITNDTTTISPIHHNGIIEKFRGDILEKRGPPKTIATTPTAAAQSTSPKSEKTKAESSIKAETKTKDNEVVALERPSKDIKKTNDTAKETSDIQQNGAVIAPPPKKAPPPVAPAVPKYSPALAALALSAPVSKPVVAAAPTVNPVDFPFIVSNGTLDFLAPEKSEEEASKPVAASRTNGVRKTVDMAAEAKKRLESETFKMVEDNIYVAPKPVEILPGPGGLKRKREGSDQPNKKKQITWPDLAGVGSIKVIHTFEIEGSSFQKSASNYKKQKETKKDMRDKVKMDRAMERNAIAHKLQEVMQKTMDWTKPSLLVLSIQIQDNSRNPIISTERDNQAKRLLLVLETKYLDETLIPNDPDPPLIISDNKMDTEVDSIPWDLPGAALEQDIYSNQSVNYYDPNYNNMGMSNHMNVTPQMNMNTSMNMNMSMIPDIIFQLDDDIIRAVHEDRSLISQVLYPNGSINDGGVALLRMRLSSMDQYAGYNNTPSMPFPLHNQPNNFSFANPNPGFPQYNNYQFENDNLMNNFPNRPNILPNPLLPFPQGMPGMGMPLQPPLPGLGLVQPPVNLNAVKKSRVVGRVPCQWFNTPNGCSWGDKCTFAHNAISVIGGPNKPGPGGRRTGPGGR